MNERFAPTAGPRDFVAEVAHDLPEEGVAEHPEDGEAQEDRHLRLF